MGSYGCSFYHFGNGKALDTIKILIWKTSFAKLPNALAKGT